MKQYRGVGSGSHIRRFIHLAVFSFALIFTNETLANPVLQNVAAGQVTVQQVPNSTVVNQASQKAIINWQSFNIKAGEKTHFQQPAGGIALNRISPLQGASQIYGHLSATGKIILVNQAGIFFGPGSRVDVGGIIASTSDISDANFLAGKYRFDKPSQYNGSVINQGTITAAENGLVALVGNGVRNDGTIQAHTGSVVLASGNKFTVDLNGDQLVSFAVDEATVSAGVDHNGNKLRDAVSNTGKIIADGGTIIMTARAARGVVDRAINMKGVAQARSVSKRGGVIILDGGSGRVSVSGKLYASGKQSGSRGGTVKILARKVHVKSSAVIDVSGDAGGGVVLMGGNYQGKGPEQNAYSTYVEKGAQINADALTTGNGGRVIVWSDHDTRFYGDISAVGGALSGNGGFVETSGHYLDVNNATVNLLAPKGKTGTWLLDPTDLTITAGSTTNVNTSGTTFTGDGNFTTSTLNVTTLTNALAGANVIVQTTAGGTGSGSGDIIVGTPIVWSSATTLELSAFRNIELNNAITSSATANVILRADNTGTGIGTITGTADITTAPGGTATFYYNPSSYATPTNYGGNVVDVALTTYMLVNNVDDLQDMNTNLAGNYALGRDIDASATSGWNAGAGFVPIGTAVTPFTGLFDGQNYTISDLFINRPLTANVGLIGYTVSNISNVGLINPDITGLSAVGAIAGSTQGIIQNSYISGGSVLGFGSGVGGVAGVSNGDIINVYNTSNVQGAGSVGGIVGFTITSIQNAYNTGNVIGTFQVGGIVGAINNGPIMNSYNTGSVFGSLQTGGIAGNSHAAIQDSFNQGLVTGDDYTGGIVGLNDEFTIQNSFNQGPVFGNGLYTGGIVGFNANVGVIQDSYNLGPVSGFDIVGGIAGDNDFFSTITRTYSAGYVEASIGAGAVGGLLGANSGGEPVTNSYWDTQTSGQSTSAAGTPLTTAELQSGLPAGFLGSTWDIITDASYPYLLSIYTTTPRAISGFIPGGSSGATGLANNAVQMAVNGVDLALDGLTFGNVTTGNNGYYYFMEPTDAIADNDALITYLTGGTLANVVTMAPAAGGSLSGLNMTEDTVVVGSADTQTLTNTNALLSQAKGALSSNILYTTSGSTNVVLNSDVDLISTATTTYSLDGNITASGSGNIIFNGSVSVTSGSRSINVASGDITFNDILGGSGDLILNGPSIFNADVAGLGSLTVNDAATVNTGSMSTTGWQQYNSSLALMTDSIFNSDDDDISLNGILNGGSQTLTLTGGSGGDHTFSLVNVGSIGALTFEGNASVMNTMDFSGYVVPIVLTLSVPSGVEFDSGTLVTNTSSPIGTFTQIQQAIGTSNVLSRIILPNYPGITVTYTNPAHTSGSISDPFYFIDFIIGNPPPTPTPTPGPTPGPTPIPDFTGNTFITGTTAFIVNNRNMEVTVDGEEQYVNYFANAPWVDANINSLVQQQNAMNQEQTTKFICNKDVKNPRLKDCQISLSIPSLL